MAKDLERAAKAAAGEVMVLVHVDSMCGSAADSLGGDLAQHYRRGVIEALEQWQGHLVIITGYFEDELDDYPDFLGALEGALARAEGNGRLALRINAPDPDHDEAVRRLIRRGPLCANEHRFRLGGAWGTWHGRWGCVNSVEKTVRKLGCVAKIDENITAFEWEDELD
jgi:hypothetical protein